MNCPIRISGLSHGSTPEERAEFAKQMKLHAPRYYVALETCSRVEYYSGTGEPEPATVKHIFRVAAGLESAIPGENAIQGQVKMAYRRAQENGTLNSGLHRLFQKALRAGKLVRTHTRICEGPAGHGQAAADIIRRDYSGMQTVTCIGLNKLTASILQYIRTLNGMKFFVGNRTFDKAVDFAAGSGGHAFRLNELPRVCAESEIIISATAAPHGILKPEHFRTHRKHKPLVVFDLAAPRDMEVETVEYLKNCLDWFRYYSLADIENDVRKTLQFRMSELEKAEQIIEEQLEEYYALSSFATAK